ncbi:hypothetical protein ACFSQD_19100 [Flavihumibacter stibioxidans]|uniref:Uncharacterized protein n=1 Tax=Flavihumibacter stibioxidans TaxID=1834163 RepID=A0ABR7MBQ3_9BACT|nr:hypothetical protein [Flavihumibacter stibioxidans]MBC6492477.1 hypothetical protein [Flavihumibacter stibioxidans]
MEEYRKSNHTVSAKGKQLLSFLAISVYLLALLAPICVWAQNGKPPVYLEVISYKINPGKEDTYRNLVRNYGHRVYESVVRDKKIMGWYFYEVLMTPDTKNGYDFATVLITTNFSDLIDNPVSRKDIYTKVITGSKELSYQQFMTQLQECRTVVNREIYVHRAGLDPKTPVSKYVQIDFMKPLPGKAADYVRMESEVFYPIHQERIKIGALTDWALYEKLLPFTGDSRNDFVTANFFDNPRSIIDPKYEEAFNNIPNNIDFIRLSGQIDQTRKLVKSDIWKLVDYVDQMSLK